MRKLVKILLSLVLAAPAVALALGVGEVQLHSALNQRMDAEIKLLSVDPADADTIEVSLASYDDFARVGLERPSSLMFLRFKVEQSPNGEYYIKLSSREAIREPFLDFLLEVKWRSGRVLREYTLLLDPPVSHREAAPAVTAPVTARSVVSAPVVQPASGGEEDEFVPPPSSIPGAVTEKAPVSKAEPTAVVTAAPTPAAPAVSAAPTGSIVYGPVKANETLWSIARKLRPNNDITDQQMMMALLIANPYAFIDNNINRLKKGYVLRIDDLSVLTAMSKAEASREVSRQTRAWQDYRSTIAARAAKRKPVSTAKKTPTAAIGTSKKEPKLELVSPQGKTEQPGKAADGTEEVRQELMLALESSAAQRKENEELQKRLEGLEERLQDMQRLLTLKDSDLAALQDQLREQGQALSLPSTKAEPTTDEASAKPKAQIDAEAPALEATSPAEPDSAVKAGPGSAVKQDQAGATAVPEQAEKAPDEAGPVEKPAAATAAEKPAPANKAAVKRTPVVVPPVEEPGIVDTIFGTINDMLNGTSINLDMLSPDEPLVMYAGGGAVLLILLLLLIKARRKRGGGFQESILTGGSSSMMGSQSDEENSETSFLSDLAISGMGKGTIDTDETEVDPLTEADVFMAYGRHQQAEEVLSKALEKHPERLDVRTKLLEVYYNLQDTEKFVALAATSADGLKAQPGEWDKVAKMGHELAPDNALFAVAAGAVAAAAYAGSAAQESFAGDVLDIGLDLDELTSEMESEGSGGDSGFDLGLDFDDLDEEEPPSTAGGGTDATLETSDSDFDFDLDLGAEVVEESAPSEETELDFDLGGMDETEVSEADSDSDFDLDLGTEDIGSESEGMSLDFGMEDVGSETEGMSLDSGMEEDVGSGTDGMSLDFGSELEDIGSEEEGMSLDFGDTLGADETEAADEEAGLDLGDLDDLDFGDLGLEESTPLAQSTEDDGFDLDMSALESGGDDLGGFGDLDDDGMFSDVDGDEIATKLDLAQAYIEMGDSDGARSMLEEIAEGGNDEQKQQAQALLARI